MITTLIYIVIALCLIGTVLWAFDKYVSIPAPFAWVKGLMMFVLVLIACWFIWDSLVAQHVLGTGTSRIFR